MRDPEMILVVEDCGAMRTMVGAMLEAGGYRPVLTGSGDEALAQADALRGQISLAILDMILPDTCGEELGRRLSEMTPAPRLLFMSALAPEDVARSTSRLRWAPYLEKPFEVSQLLAHVQAALACS